MIALNAAMAEALIDFKTRVDALIANGVDKTKAILQVVREDIKTCKPIHFDGNGYSEEWQEEARRRGLDTERSCPLIFDRYLDESSVKMFETTHVFTRNEIEARNEIKWETYTKKVQVEARIFGDMCMNHIIPVATRYQSALIDTVHKVQEVFTEETAARLNAKNLELIKKIMEHTSFIAENADRLVENRKVAKLELIVDDEMWPLPKYRELLFIR